MKDLTVVLPNRPGALSAVGEALGKAGVNILGFCAFAVGGGGIANMLVEDAELAGDVLGSIGFQVQHAQEVLVVPVEDRPGALGEITKKVAEAGVNLSFAYLTADMRLVMGSDDPEDVERARKVL
ncbi:MAG: ACT domain-containing protein [Actinomycetota bacterium]